MQKRIFQIGFLFFFGFNLLFPQTPPFYHYLPQNGLASSTVYDILQDRDGFIWFSTLNGLNRFDGKRFITYNTQDGLNSNSLTSLSEGKDGEIYIGNHLAGINILRNGKITNLRKTFNETNFSIQYLLNTEKILYAYSSFGSIVKINTKVKVDTDYKIKLIYLHDRPTLNRLLSTANGNFLVLTSNDVRIFNNDSLKKIQINGLREGNMICGALDRDGSILLGSEGIIYRIKSNSVVASIPIKLYNKNSIYHLFVDSHRNIWFSISGKGFFFIPFGSKKFVNVGKTLGLDNTQICKFYEDKEGNIWIATYGKGVYCLTSPYLKNFSEVDGLTNNYINCIQKDISGKIFIGTINGLNVFEDEKINKLKYNDGAVITGYVNNIIPSKKYMSVSITSETPKSKEINFRGALLRFFRYQSFEKTSSGQILYGSVGNNIRIFNDFNSTKYKSYFIFGNGNYLNRINHIYEDREKNIWIGTFKGLCKLSYQKGNADITKWEKTFFMDDPVLSSNITSIYENKDNIWFTSSNGIAIYNLKKNLITSYTNLYGYDLSSSTSITIDDKDRIWIGNMKGVYCYDGKSLKYINSNLGLPSSEVLSLFYDKKVNKIYIGTSNGFSELDLYLFDHAKQSHFDIKIINVKAGDSLYLNYSNLVFNPEQHDVKVEFIALNYSSPNSVIYKYKLNDDNWVETGNDFLNFISLKHGKYKLQLKARTQNSGWSKPYSLAFTIKPRFVETVWFELLIISVIVSLSVFLIINRLKLNNRKIREELELSQRINDLKHQALSAMMNPHFIFNSLNSVQYLINSKKNEEANNYIAMMAKLIRKNLYTAGSGFILLTEEIKRLKLYLDLEKMRFDEKFSYKIIIANEIDTSSIMIPNMIIQPFVENSLWHGIINSGKKGVISISFSFENIEIDSILSKSLIIKITDNGIGINKALMSQKEDHISKGIKIIEERLQLLSKKMELPKPIILEDLSNRHNNYHGTEVIISLPLPLYKIISIY